MSNQSNKIDVKAVLNIAFRLFIVCTIIAAVVAGVNALTADKIAENEQQVIDNTIRSVFDKGNIEKIDYESNSSVNSIYKISDDDNTTIGYSVICAPKGFGGEIQMLVAFDAAKSIAAVRVMSHSETPGIGDKITSADHASFLEQFVGKNTELTYGNDNVDKISGSSKSSNAVLKGVNEAISAINEIAQ